MEAEKLHKYQRQNLQFEQFSKFKLREKRFNRQFSSIYLARLAALRDHVSQKARAKWGEHTIVQLLKLADGKYNGPCIVVGTLYKHQELKPSVLRELSQELQLVQQPPPSNYASLNDTLFLEDETLRVQLTGNKLNTQWVVTGIVCAVFGRVLENGWFLVEDWCFPECPTKPATELVNGEGKVLIISGLDIANNPESLSLNLLFEWITGMIGNEDSQQEQTSVVCVIIAGNSIRGAIETFDYRNYSETKKHNKIAFQDTALATNRFDKFLLSIVQCCSVILMPGEFDPADHILPQQPFHPCILPHCSRFTNLYGATNPWIGKINSRTILGSSGQPIRDILKVAGLANASALTWLEHTLHWRHIMPTAPDTLPVYPYFETDPFIIEECPDIYFAGNMEKYETKLLEVDSGHSIRLICVPKFSKSQMGVVVDLKDLRTWPISFGSSPKPS